MKRGLNCLLSTLCFIGACSKQETSDSQGRPSPNSAVPIAADQSQAPVIDACALLTHEEIASIQGEAPSQMTKSEETEGGLSVAQCLFTLPMPARILTLRIVQGSGGADARDPRQVWLEAFAPEKLQRQHQGGRKKRPKPEKIAGVGDEAFWMSTTKTGALYVLHGNRYIRISVGGGEELEVRIKKSIALAQIVLKRLQ